MEIPFTFLSKPRTWGVVPAGTNPIVLFGSEEDNFEFSPTSNFTFGFGNFVKGKTINLFITCDASTRTIAFRETLSWMGGAPTSLAANKRMQIALVCTGNTAASVFATYAVEP